MLLLSFAQFLTGLLNARRRGETKEGHIGRTIMTEYNDLLFNGPSEKDSYVFLEGISRTESPRSLYMRNCKHP